MTLLKWLNSRMIIHIAGGVFASEIVFTFLSAIPGKYPLLASLTPLLVGIGREIIDHYVNGYTIWQKHAYDILSWALGGCVWVSLKLLQ